MTYSTAIQHSIEADALTQARNLTLPSREAMLNRDVSVQAFWDYNRQLLKGAWLEWDKNETTGLELPDESLLDSNLRNAVQQAWTNPENETLLQDLLHEVSPGVFQFQMFDPERLTELRRYFDGVADAKIPLKPPYGIALNRYGAMLDARSEGYLAAPSFQGFYQTLLDQYMRPIARLLFPEIVGFDTQGFGFSIQYEAGVDTSLRMHTDASAATLNINLNVPGETFTGSQVDFYDPKTRNMNRLSFEPGMAMIHKGSVAHAAQPIQSGQRSNLVLWLFGEGGYIPHNVKADESISAHDRWQVPNAKQDHYAPF